MNSQALVKAHGSIMMFTWIVLASTGVLFARKFLNNHNFDYLLTLVCLSRLLQVHVSESQIFSASILVRGTPLGHDDDSSPLLNRPLVDSHREELDMVLWCLDD